MNSRLRPVVAGLTLVLLGALVPVLTAPPAAAAITTLCTGYKACRQAGMSASGYAGANGSMYWLMFSGHNCTNYAAYRMVKSGMPNKRPWNGGGNATYWGTSMPHITNATPAVGSVAWWKAGVAPAGSSGHVAYVEQVVSANEIIVSQDSWGGDFSWARITRSGKGWPSGFIHFNDVPMRNTAAPAITGTAKVGAVLTVTSGSWTPASPNLTYQWMANGTGIAGATGPSLSLTPELEGKTISARVTASKLGYPTVSLVTTATPAVLPGVLRNTVQPTIQGIPQVDQTLTVDPGSWNPGYETLRLQWRADGQPIPGAWARTLVVDPSLVGKEITVTVIVGRTGYSEVAVLSKPSTRVRPGDLAVDGRPRLEGEAALGQTLTVKTPSYAPAASEEIVWLRNGQIVPGASGPEYRLTPADLGSRIRARFGLTRPGYTTSYTRTPATEQIRSTPRLRVRTEPGRGRVKVTVTAKARGVTTLNGKVLLRWRGTTIKEARLHDGVAVLRARDLPSGELTLKVVHRRTAVLQRAVVVRSVRVR